ncbi:TPA: hypothetical protein ACGD63_001048 [Serratia marcescens]
MFWTLPSWYVLKPYTGDSFISTCTVGCLLLAQKASVEAVTVELDEDIELNSGQERIYVQVKTRLKPIILSDVSGALARFAELRNEHTDAPPGKRFFRYRRQPGTRFTSAEDD